MVTSAETSFGSIWRRTTSDAPPQPDEFSTRTMALTAGTRLGHYDVTALIGEGGMGHSVPIAVAKGDQENVVHDRNRPSVFRGV